MELLILPTVVGQRMLAFARLSLQSQRSLASEIDMAEKRKVQSRSEPTRQRILDAARRQFAADGYERTTIRTVAAEADIDPSMVMRYFGSKEGLFAAAASFELQLPELATIHAKRRGRTLAQHYLQLWGRGGGGLAILLRTAATNDGAAERVRKVFRDQVVPAIAAVVSDAPAARAALISSQFLGLAYSRFVIAIPEVVKLNDSVLLDALGKTIQGYLDEPLAGSAGNRPALREVHGAADRKHQNRNGRRMGRAD
jgi:AcrR family transcriptional regulator